jgi:hypothetical protein
MRTSGIIRIVIGLALFLLALAISDHAKGQFGQVAAIVIAIEGIWIILKGVGFPWKALQTRKTPFE